MMSSVLSKKKSLWPGVFLLIISILYFQSWLSLYALWTSPKNPTYSHGPLLLIVCGYLSYKAWRKFKPVLEFQFSFLSLALLFICSVVWFLAGLGNVQIVQMLSLVFLTCLIMSTFFGIRQSTPFYFPILLLIGGIPVWDFFSPYLQWFTAINVGWITSLTITPSVREGMNILVPAGTFEVASGCSGLAYFIVSVIIGLLFSYSNGLSLKRMALQVLLTMMVAVIANIIRVYIIVLSGQLTNMTSYFITVEHISLGWGIFLIGITIYLFLASRYLHSHPHPNKDSQSDNSSTSVITARSSGPQLSVSLLILCLLAVCVAPALAFYYQRGEGDGDAQMAYLPMEIGQWQLSSSVLSYEPELSMADVHKQGRYQRAETTAAIDLTLNYFSHQEQGKEAVSDLNKLADGYRWRPVSGRSFDPEFEGFSMIQEAVISARNGEKKLVWLWHETNDLRTSSPLGAKIANIAGILLHRPSISTVVISTDIRAEEGIQIARSWLREFSMSATDIAAQMDLR